MVIKGGARAEADKLAAHLLRVDTNERVDVRELLGVCAPDLTAALLEMEAVAAAARSRRPFYHASINTAPNELMNDAQKVRAIDRLEQELGLTGQPRVVVEHVKEGREHLHVAWSRIDGETLRAIPDSHNFRRHEIVARELEHEFAHARVQGAHHERDGVERPARRPSQAEMMQAERSGIAPEQAREQLRELWRSTDTGQAFAAALEDAGWILARGDKRGFVALDPAGEARAVNKDITGLPAAKVRERLADLDAERLPSVDQARERLREREAVPALEIGRAETAPEPEQAPETSQHDLRARDLQPQAEPVHQAERDEAGELAAYAERQRQGFEAAQCLRAGFEAAEAARRQPIAEPSPEAVQQLSREAGPSVTRPEVVEDRVAAILRELDERFRTVPPLPVREAAPELVREPEAERVRERARTPELAAPTLESVRPSLFQMLTMGVRAWWQGLRQAPQPDRDADRQHDNGGDRPATHISMPARTPTPAPEPVRQQEPVRQPAPEPSQSRPAERMRRSIAEEWLAEARAELAAERARETPAQRADREREEAERSHGRGDGGRERSRYHHAQLRELLHPLRQGHDTRRRRRQP